MKERLEELRIEIEELTALIEELEPRVNADGGETVVPL